MQYDRAWPEFYRRNEVTHHHSKLQIQLGRLMMQKKTKDANAEASAEAHPISLLKTFLADLKEAHQGDDGLRAQLEAGFRDFISEREPKPDATPKGEPETNAAKNVVPMCEYDETGNLTDPLTLLRQNGFNIGDYAALCSGVVPSTRRGASGSTAGAKTPRAANAEPPASAEREGVACQHSVKVAGACLRGGKPLVTLRCVIDDQHNRDMPVADFLEKYRMAKPEECRTPHPNYPARCACESKEWKRHTMKCRMMTALENVSNQVVHELPEGGVPKMVEVVDKPKRAILAARDIQAGELVLVPETTKISYKAKNDKVVPGEVVIHREPEGRFVLESANSDKFIAEFWWVKRDCNSKAVNMAPIHLKSEGYGVVNTSEWPRKGTKKKGEKAYPHEFQIPALVNRSEIKKGVELVAFIEKATPEEKVKKISQDIMLKRKWAADEPGASGKL